MLKISYKTKGFPTSLGMPKSGNLKFTWSELVWAAVTVGKGGPFHMSQHGMYSNFEWIYREFMLYANLKELADGRLTKSSAYLGLDPSEKSAISYFLGMTLTKLFCDQKLGVSWLMHLDVYRSRFPMNLVSNQRPDFLGRNKKGEWVVLESKGRSNGADNKALKKAKEQACSLVRIGADIPVLNAGALSYFNNEVLEMKLDDPPIDEEGLMIDLGREEFFKGYYQPYNSWLDTAETKILTFRGQEIRAARIESADVTIGIIVDDRDPISRLEFLEAEKITRTDKGKYLGRDGIYIEAGPSWSTSNMQKEPQERNRLEVQDE